MKKKTIVILSVLLFVLAGGLVCWLSPPEYGEGYSEQQRKLWNERRALFPVAVQYNGETAEMQMLLRFISGSMEVLYDKNLGKNMEQDKVLRRRQLELRDAKGGTFSPDWDKAPVIDSLPANCITEQECLNRARGGDADAWLVMGSYMVLDRERKSVYVPTWRQVHDADYCFSQAEALGRPGARFMRRSLELIQQNCKQKYYTFPLSETHSYEQLDGYSEFLQCMRDGDFLLYSIWRESAVVRGNQPPEMDVLREALRERVRASDVRAMEGMAAVQCSSPLTAWSLVLNELKESFWGRLVDSLPSVMQESGMTFLQWIGVLSPDGTEYVRNLQEATACARKAAEQGSRVGMDYWLRFGLLTQQYLSKEDWENVFRYHRILMEEGYAPYMEAWLNGTSPDQELLQCFYPEKIWECYHKQLVTSLDARGGLLCDADGLPAGTDLQGVRKSLDDLIARDGADHILDVFLIRLVREPFAADVLEVYATRIQELAEEGDPHAQLVMGGLYELGQGVPRDLGAAWRCYEAGLKELDPTLPCQVRFRDVTSDDSLLLGHHVDALQVSMLAMLVNYSKFPGRDDEKAFAAARQLEQHADSEDGLSGIINYYLGRMYEEGIGTSPDKEAAIRFYTKGQKFNPSCAERLEQRQGKSFCE